MEAPHAPPAPAPHPLQSSATMSKKRYAALQAALRDRFDDSALVDDVLGVLRDVLRFDPEKSTYSAEAGRKMVEYRRLKRAAKANAAANAPI